MKKKNKVLKLLWIISFILIIGSSIYIFGNKSLTLFQEQVWIPKYWTGRCEPRADNLAELKITTHTDKPTFYHCTTQEAKKWIPLVNGVQCEYTIRKYSFAEAWICSGFVDSTQELKAKCNKEFSLFNSFSEVSRSITVNSGDSVYIDTTGFGEADLTVKYPSYGLKTRSADGFENPTTTNCLLNTLTSNFHTINLKDKLEVLPDVPFNAVTNLEPAITRQAVRLSYIRDNEPIYITRPGFYNLIKTADDGFIYVDTTQEFSDNRIECIPGVACSDEAKIIKITEQTCDKYGGNIVGYAPVTSDSSQLCKYSCSSGKIKKTNDCIKVPSSCPVDTPLWDTTTGKCVGIIGIGEKNVKTSFDFKPLYVLIIGILIAIALYLYRTRK